MAQPRPSPLPIVPHPVSFPIKVRFCETDLMGIVHHANYLQYFEAGRVEWLKVRGISYEKWLEKGVHLPVVEARLRYRKAARFDDELVVETRVVELTRVTVRFGYRIMRVDAGAEVLLCEGDTQLACVGADLSLRRLPPDLAEVLRGGELPPAASPAEGQESEATVAVQGRAELYPRSR